MLFNSFTDAQVNTDVIHLLVFVWGTKVTLLISPTNNFSVRITFGCSLYLLLKKEFEGEMWGKDGEK